METAMKNPITIDKVVELANISKPTVYRKVKTGDFPKPKKVPRPTNRGPEKVNRWEEDDVMKWAINNGKAEAEDAINLFPHDESEAMSFYQKHRFVINGAMGGTLAGLLWAVFHG
jgi:predicted DNA-binding transcriptional regulator AlpA